MTDQTKKISFGFSKLAKKTAIVFTQVNKIKQDDDVSKVEFIDCLEGKSIKLKEPVKPDQGPLIIPLTRSKEEKSLNNQNNSKSVPSELYNSKPLQKNSETESIKLSNEASEQVCITKDNANIDCQVKKETLDEIAAREILEDLNRNKTEDEEKRVFSVPLTTNAPSGEKESSLEDYDNVPVTEFGMAMLRGMGWAPGKGIGKNEKLIAPSLPAPRPKGMGLGADKVIKPHAKKSSNEDLKMVKGSYIRVLAGSEKDAYGQLEGFDDETGRLIVKLALKNVSISLNEFMVQLVDSNEFRKNSKVINNSKYEQYKEDEVRKEASVRKVKERDSEIEKKLLSPRQSENKVKEFSKNRSSSSEREDRNQEEYKKCPSRQRSSRSPGNRDVVIKDKSQSRGHKYHKTTDSKYDKKFTSHSDSKKHRSYSSSSSSSSQSLRRNSCKIKSHSSMAKNSVKGNPESRRRPSSNTSNSDSSVDYSRKDKNKHKQKKSSSNKYRSRSRSRSPKKHKHKKSKKHY